MDRRVSVPQPNAEEKKAFRCVAVMRDVARKEMGWRVYRG
jgi:hypothetical protein